MGYTTRFRGRFELDKPLTQEHADWFTEGAQDAPGAPNSYLQWIVSDDMRGFEWDNAEKFYHYVEWLRFIVAQLAVWGYVVNGRVIWRGEELGDDGVLEVRDNVVTATPYTRM